MRYINLSIFLLISLFAVAQKPTVTRIDPPNWWAGFTNQHVSLLVQGANLSDAVTLQAKGVALGKVYQPKNKNYVVVQLVISPTADAQTVVLSFSNKGKKININYELKARTTADKALMGLSAKDFIYLITPDRFANGNPKNDVAPLFEENTINRADPYGRHGGDLAGISQKLDYLQDLGVTALWLNPVVENNQPKESYHGYAITDHYKIDPRFGTNQEYAALVQNMHKRGIKMIMDVVYNHWGDQHYLYKNLPDSAMIHWFDKFTKTNYRATSLLDPYAAKEDADVLKDGWFDHHMPDLDQTHGIVADYLIQNSIWWIETFGIDAYRIDTYAYPDQEFMALLTQRILAEYPNFFIFAETWVHGIQVQNYFMGDNPFRAPFNSHLQSVTDFQWYFGLVNGIHEKTDWNTGMSRMYYALAADYMYKNPQDLVTFADNHDLARYFGHCGKDFKKWQIGMGLLLTSRGIPQLYYGTEILMAETDGHGKIREDFLGGWPEDSVNKFTASGRTALENEAFDFIKNLAEIRKNNPAITEGTLTQFTPQDGVYSYIREAQNQKIFVATNNDANKIIVLNMARYANYLPKGTRVKNVVDGSVFTISETINLNYGILILEVLAD